jgi:Transmembrane secretion effector
VSGRGYRWYLAAQVVSLAGTMMNYTALFWLVLHLRYAGPAALAAVDAAACLPMLLFSRRASRGRRPGGGRLPGPPHPSTGPPNSATGFSQQTARSHASPRPSLASPAICRA